MSITIDRKVHAIFKSGTDLVAVPIVGWLDDEAVLLPLVGGRLLRVSAVPHFLGLWEIPKIDGDARVGGGVYETREREQRAALGALIRARFPDQTGGRLRHEAFAPEVTS